MSMESSDAFMATVIDKAADRIVDKLNAKVVPVRARFMRPEQAAEFIGVDRTTLGNMRSEGRGPKYRKVGNRVVYSLENLIAFIEQYPLQGSGRLDGGDV